MGSSGSGVQLLDDHVTLGDVEMRRVEIARRLGVFAHAAELRGNHRKAAELFAEALRALLCGTTPREPASGDDEAASDRMGRGAPAVVSPVESREEL